MRIPTTTPSAPSPRPESAQVIAVEAMPECSGPLLFVIRWRCRCGAEQSFQRGVSLLPSQPLACPACGTAAVYRYPEKLFSETAGKLDALVEAESSFFEGVFRDQNGSVGSMGKNFFFVVSAMAFNSVLKQRNG